MPLSEFWELTFKQFFKAVEFHSYQEWLSLHQTRLIMWSNLKPHMGKKSLRVTDVMKLGGDDMWFKQGREVTKEEVDKLIKYTRQFID